MDHRPVDTEVPERATLLELLRDHLRAAGPRLACDRGDCGACMVFLDGAPAYACLTVAASCEGSDVVTIEGLARGDARHPLQRTTGDARPEPDRGAAPTLHLAHRPSAPGDSMSTTVIQRPAASEYAPYYESYVSVVPAGDLLSMLARQVEETAALLEGLSDEEAGYRYQPGKWSIKEVVGHITDAERIFVYRALCAARGERVELPAFAEDDYVAAARFDRRALRDLVAELRAVRAATVAFFAGLSEEDLARTHVANHRPYTVRALAYIIAGHERHHARLLRERYGLGTRD
ncbi:MAG TPA: DinB family protein [Gemmatimonadaceae bacterium]|nr:DinB family protein [Gemmatimonadaceae bacterium]